ncbi:MAG: hypothetical protein L0I62_03755 [Gammaproteobacteria bacterium]|nr:hypothetical protein [Gammaproteobacteria bacterium]
MYHAFVFGQIPAILANSTTRKTIPRTTMAPLLAKLPPANASYMLRVVGDDGKPILNYGIENGELTYIDHYVYKNGELVHVDHYTYKNGETTKAKR